MSRKDFKLFCASKRLSLAALIAGALLGTASTGNAQTWTGATNANWNNSGNWSGGIPASDLALTQILFNASSTANLATTNDLGSLSINKLTIANPTGAVSIAGAATLTIGTGGIDMSAATQDLTITQALGIGAAQSWNVQTGRTLTVSAVDFANLLTVTGAGTVTLSTAGTGAGGVTVDNGATLNINNATALGTGTLTTGTAGGFTVNNTSGAAIVTSNAVALSTGNLNFAGAAATNNLTLGDVTMSTAGRTITVTNAGGTLTVGAIGGAFPFTKAGAGNLVVTGASSYTGATNIGLGALTLSGGNNRLPTTTIVNFTGNTTGTMGTLALGGNTQSIAGLTFTTTTTGVTSTYNITGSIGSALTVTGGNITIGGSTTANASQAVNMSTLGAFTYNNSAGAISVGGQGGTGTFVATGTLQLAGTNTITALSLLVGATAASGGSVSTGTVSLGQTNTINISTINLGTNGRTGGTLNFRSGLAANPTLKIRGTDGTSAVTTLAVSANNSNAASTTSTFDLVAGYTGANASSLDAVIGTLAIGNRSSGTSNFNATGTFAMGGGTMTVTTANVGLSASTAGAGTGTLSINDGGTGGTINATTIRLGQATTATANATGTLTLTSGTVNVTNLILGDKSNGTAVTNSNINLNTGSTLAATTIQTGTRTAGTGAPTVTFTWNGGTLSNLTGSNLDVNGTTQTWTVNLLTAGAKTFNVDSSRTATVASTVTLAGAGTGALSKIGGGTLIYNGVNTYTAATSVQNGILRIGVSNAINAASTTSVTATGSGNTATLDLNNFNLALTNVLTLGGSTASSTPVVTTGTGILAPNGGITYDAANNPLGGTISGNLDFGAASRTVTVGDSTNAANDLTISAAIAGSGGSMIKTGAGTLALTGTNTYTGNTTVNGGILNVTGSLANNSSANVLIAAPDDTLLGNPMLTRTVGAGLNTYAGFGSKVTATSIEPASPNPPLTGTALQTTADILMSNTNADVDNMSMQWRFRTAAEAAGSNPNAVLSDVLSLTGMDNGADIFTLQMSYSDAALTALGLTETSIAASGELRLGYNDAGTWKTATVGNTVVGSTFAGVTSWASFASANSINSGNLNSFLGYYGVDPSGAGGVVWAVLDHNSEFAVIPEPSTLVLGGLALLGFAGVGLRRRRQRA